MSKIPFKKPKATKHPVIQEYEDLLSASNIPREEWDPKFMEFYDKNINFIDDIENLNTSLAITRVIGMKIVYTRILDGKSEYKKELPIVKDLETLLSKLDSTYYNQQDTYLNAKKWIGISLGRNKKHVASNKVFKEIINLDTNKELHKKWIAANYYGVITNKILNPTITICLIIIIWNTIMQFFDNYDLYIPKSYSIIVSILLFLAIIAYFNMDTLTRKIVNRKYK